jgi:stage II sporulation protein D
MRNLDDMHPNVIFGDRAARAIRWLGAAAAACALLLAASGALAGAAAAKTATWVLRGAGYGHGIGMSQYGAQGYAQQGRDYKQILGHYYSGTSIGQAATQTIRVILRQGVSTVKVKGATRATGGKQLSAAKTYTIKRSSNSIKLYDAAGNTVGDYNNGLLITDNGKPLTLIGTAIGGVRNGAYRDGMEFTSSALGGMNVVNTVDLDNYVQGVVPGEEPTSWRAEALKAQAVAARSYALATDAGGSLFDQYPDTRSQMYLGAGGETAATNAAVQGTAGQVVLYRGKLVPTYFFSTSGGQTENVENVFYGAKPEPYLKSVADPFDNGSPKHRWTIRYSQATMQAKLGGLVKGRLKAIKVVKHGVSPRVVRADVIGTGGRVRTDGVTLRSRLGLFDTWVTFKLVRR